MQWPPEKYYPAQDADFGYLYTAIADFAQQAGAQRNNAVLVPDAQTEEDIRANKPPTYKVLGKGPLGEAILLPGRFGGDELMKSATDSIRENAAVENSLKSVNYYAGQEDQLKRLLEVTKNTDQIAGLRTGITISPEQAALSDKLYAVQQQKHAAIMAAIERGHINNQAVIGGLDSDETVSALAKTLEERLTADSALVRKFSQATLGVSKEDLPDVLSKLVEKELKVPDELAGKIVLRMIGAN
jgi:hypothetical protein